jgi:hypothetical protein
LFKPRLSVLSPLAWHHATDSISRKVQPGLFTVTVHTYAQDGSALPLISVPGVASVGSTASFQIQYSSTPGGGSSVTRVATFPSTLADISNSFTLGLIDNQGIANSLSQKIHAAQAATGPARNDILNAFKNDVNAQTGKHVADIASQVLLQDAASLISQNP